MKTLIKKITIAAMALVVVSPVAAQSENAAFYIYQNNGHFNGFFYDEVQEIHYSKFDKEGFEHSSYVSQEIVTADSTYRFMLAEIDSVSFVQPEIIYNPRLRDMDEMGLSIHLISANGLQLVFDNTLSSDMMPHEGDVLVCYDFDRFDGGFGGKVSSVNQSGGQIIVECVQLEDFSDIFKQFVTVEEYADDGQGNLVPRRIAGMKIPKRVKGNYDGSIFNFSANPHIPWQSGDFTASIDMNVQLQTDLRASWNFPLFGKKQFSIEMTEEIGVGLGVTVDGKLKQLLETKFGSVAPIYLPAAVPVFQVKLIPEGFIRSEVHATFNIQTPLWKKKMSQSISFDDWTFDGSMTMCKTDDDDNSGPSANGSLNGFIQGGCKFPFIIRTNEFFASVLDAEVGLNLFVGPKLSGEINLNITDAARAAVQQGVDLRRSTFLYDLLKDTKLSFTPLSVDYEMKSRVKAFVGADEELTLFDGSGAFGTRDWYLLPGFSSITPSVNYKHCSVDVQKNMGRLTLMDPTVGVGLYRGDGKLMGIYYPENGKPDDESGGATSVSFELEQGGPYVVRPVINVMNYEFPASVGSGFESDAPYFYFEEENPGEKIVLTPNEQIHRVNIATNCEVEATTIGDWGGFEVTKVNNKVFLINVPERGGVHEGVNFQTFTATYKNEQDETVNDQHSYCFYQKPNYRYSSLNTNNTFISIPLQEEDGVLQIGEDFFVGMNLSGLEGDPEQGFTILGAKESHETDSPAPYLQEGYYTKSVDTEYTLSISISPKGFPWSEQVNMTDETLPYITGMFLTKKRVSKDYHFIRDEETGELKEELYDTQTDAFEVSLGNMYSTPSNLSRYDQFEIPYSLGLNPSDIVQSFYSYTSSTKGATNYYHFNPDGMVMGNITLNW